MIVDFHQLHTSQPKRLTFHGIPTRCAISHVMTAPLILDSKSGHPLTIYYKKIYALCREGSERFPVFREQVPTPGSREKGPHTNLRQNAGFGSMLPHAFFQRQLNLKGGTIDRTALRYLGCPEGRKLIFKGQRGALSLPTVKTCLRPIIATPRLLSSGKNEPNSQKANQEGNNFHNLFPIVAFGDNASVMNYTDYIPRARR